MTLTLFLFYLAAGIALLSTVLALTRANAAHALIFLIVSLLAIAVLFFFLGAPFAAALEIVIYAGAIMVLFVFVVMMLNLSEGSREQERAMLDFSNWWLPGLLTAVLLVELLYVLTAIESETSVRAVIPKEVGLSLFGPYVLGVELASMLLLAGLVGAYHLGHRFLQRDRGRRD